MPDFPHPRTSYVEQEKPKLKLKLAPDGEIWGMLQGRSGPEKGIHSPLRPSAQEPSWSGRSPFLLRTTHLPGGLRDVPPHLSPGSHMPSHLPSTHHYMSAPAVNTHTGTDT